MAEPATIRARNTSGEWTSIGIDRETGIVPESLTMAADKGGPSTLGFTLKRDPRTLWDDLQSGNQIEVEVNGSVVWGGRINLTPGSGRGASGLIQVAAQGWRAHLDDDQVDKYWVRTRLSDWRDARSFLTFPVNNRAKDSPTVSSNGLPTLGFAGNTTATTGDASAVALDLGPNRKWKRVVIETVAETVQADTVLYVLGTDAEGWADATRLDAISAQALTSGATQVFSGTISTSRRYAHILWYYNGAGGPWGVSPPSFRVKTLRLFDQTRDESGNASILKASDVVKDVLSSGALPLLSSSTDLIDTTAFNIPEFAPDGYKTPNEIMSAVNAFHDYRLGVTAEARLFFRANPTEPLYVAGEWSGDAFSDASLGNLDALYNRVIVEYTAADGTPAVSVRTATSGILTRQGLIRTKRLPVNAVLTSAAANQIGDVWLAKHNANAPLSGAITLGVGAVRSTVTGAEIHPALLLAAPGERLLLSDRTDPETGGVGRVGTIVTCTYDPIVETAQVQLDNDTASLEGWISRLQVVQGAG